MNNRIVIALIGDRGAGKSTFGNCLLGLPPKTDAKLDAEGFFEGTAIGNDNVQIYERTFSARPGYGEGSSSILRVTLEVIDFPGLTDDPTAQQTHTRDFTSRLRAFLRDRSVAPVNLLIYCTNAANSRMTLPYIHWITVASEYCPVLVCYTKAVTDVFCREFDEAAFERCHMDERFACFRPLRHSVERRIPVLLREIRERTGTVHAATHPSIIATPIANLYAVSCERIDRIRRSMSENQQQFVQQRRRKAKLIFLATETAALACAWMPVPVTDLLALGGVHVSMMAAFNLLFGLEFKDASHLWRVWKQILFEVKPSSAMRLLAMAAGATLHGIFPPAGIAVDTLVYAECTTQVALVYWTALESMVLEIPPAQLLECTEAELYARLVQAIRNAYVAIEQGTARIEDLKNA